LASGRRDQDDDQQNGGVNNARDRGAAAVFDVCCGASNRASGGDASKERAENVGETLSEQFLI